jgi:uncharacterized protein
MERIAYRERDCRDTARIDRFLGEERIGIVAVGGDTHPYAVPVNFVWHEGAVFFHGMGSGKRVRLLAEHPQVCFTVFRDGGTVLDPVACHVDTSYFSVVVLGRAERLTDPGQAASALGLIVEKYAPGRFSQAISARLVERYRSSLDHNPVAVHRITVEGLTAKENRTPPSGG